MIVKPLDKFFLYEALARMCVAYRDPHEECFAINENIGCPFETSKTDKTHPCYMVRPEDWKKAFGDMEDSCDRVTQRREETADGD